MCYHGWKEMSRGGADKILGRWRQKCPGDAPLADVEQVLDAYLSEWCRRIEKGGSHLYEVHHPIFEKLNLFDGGGRFVVYAHGNRVKKFVLKDLLQAIETLEIIARVDAENEPG